MTDETPADPKPKIIATGDLISNTFNIYRRNWQKFACLLLLPLLVSYLASLISLVLDSYSSSLSWPIAWLVFTVVIVLVVALMAWYVLTYISEFLLIKDLSQEVRFGNLGEWYSRAKPYFWIFLAISIIYAVLTLLGLILLIIPGVIFMIFYSFAIYAVIFEDHKFEGAFGRSRELVRGYWWAVFGRILAGIALVYLAYLIIGGLLALLVWPLALILHLQSNQILFSSLYNLLTVFVGLVIGPLSLLYVYNIYQSLKEVH